MEISSATPRPIACVEAGGAGVQTVVFRGDADPLVLEGSRQPDGAALALAVPGLIEGKRVVAASNLGWYDVDPVEALGLPGPAVLVCNDAEAAALGEAVLRGPRGLEGLVYLGLGTGVGGAVVDGGVVVASNLFGHGGGFSDAACPCGRTGCLETVAAGWALPEPLSERDIARAGLCVAKAIDAEPAAGPRLVVIGGGIAARHPSIVDRIAARLPGRRVEASLAPTGTKSAAAWGLRHLANPLVHA